MRECWQVQARIAIIDDDTAFSESIAQFLHDEEPLPVVWDGTEEPLALLRRERPALAPLDLRVYRTSCGRGMLEQLRQDATLDNLLVVACSADQPFFAMQAERLRGLQAIQATVLDKPFDLDALGRLLRRLPQPIGSYCAVAWTDPC